MTDPNQRPSILTVKEADSLNGAVLGIETLCDKEMTKRLGLDGAIEGILKAEVPEISNLFESECSSSADQRQLVV